MKIIKVGMILTTFFCLNTIAFARSVLSVGIILQIKKCYARITQNGFYLYRF